MSRIEKTLDLVSKGHKDLPERQQTLRGAIEWSYNLLSPETQKAFRQLGVFRRSWTMQGADAVLNSADNPIDIEEMTERLLDVSLIKPVTISHSSEPRFDMLQTVHEYAREMLDNSFEAQQTKECYAAYFLTELKESEGKLWGRTGEAWLDRIEYEYQNIRAAFYKYIGWQQWQQAWEFIPLLAPYWTIRGGFSESSQMIYDARITDRSLWADASIQTAVKAKTLTWAGYSTLFLFDFDNGFSMLSKAEELAESIGDHHTLGYALAFHGCYGSYLQLPDSEHKVLRCKELIDKFKDPVLHVMWLLWSSEYFRQKGQMDTVLNNFELARRLALDDGNTYILGAVHIVKFTFALLNPEVNWQSMLEQAHEMYALFSAKGFKGLKAAAFHVMAHSHMRFGNLPEAKNALIKGLEYSRAAGEKESEVYSCMEAAAYLALNNQWPDAFTTFGALDGFIEVSNFPLIGGAEVEYNLAKNKLLAHWNNPDLQHAYARGKRLSISEGVMYALKAITA